MYRIARERIIAAEVMKLERRQARERNGGRNGAAAMSSDRAPLGSSAASPAGTWARSRPGASAA